MVKRVIIAAAIAMSALNINAYANIEKAEFNILQSRLEVSGTVEKELLPNALTVRLFKPESDTNDLKSALYLVDYVDLMGKEYNVSYKMNSFENGNYKLCVTDADGKTEIKYVTVLDSRENTSLMNDLNAAHTAELMEAVFQNHDYFLKGIGTIDEIRELYPECGIERAIAEKIAGLSFQDVNGAVNEAIKGAVVSAVNCAEDEAEFTSLTERYKSDIGFDTSKIYGELYLTNRSSKFINKNYTSAAAFIKDFNDTVILDNINAIQNYKDVMKILTAAEDYLKTADFNGYNALKTEACREYVQKQVAAAKPYSDISVLESVFNSAVANAPAALVPSAGGTGGGGGGAGGSSGAGNSSSSGNTSLVSVLKNVEEVIFSDLSNVKWAEESILELYKKGIVTGTGEKKFDPNGLVTREQFAKMIVMAFGMYDETAVCSFDDIQNGAWYGAYVASAVNSGIVFGIDTGIFGTGKNITREDMAVMAYRAAMKTGKISDAEGKKFEDDYLISEYAKAAVYALKANGVMSGKGEGNFEPKAYATRAEAARMIYALINR